MTSSIVDIDAGNGPSRRDRVVLDTNVFVAAGFNPGSHSARLVEAVRVGGLVLIWNAETRAETRAVISQIPPLSWEAFSGCFGGTGEYLGGTRPEEFGAVPDAADRQFAALAAAAGAVLVSSDHHLLDARRELAGQVKITPPGEFAQELELG